MISALCVYYSSQCISCKLPCLHCQALEHPLHPMGIEVSLFVQLCLFGWYQGDGRKLQRDGVGCCVIVLHAHPCAPLLTLEHPPACSSVVLAMPFYDPSVWFHYPELTWGCVCQQPWKGGCECVRVCLFAGQGFFVVAHVDVM